jgi:hypothetical protein
MTDHTIADLLSSLRHLSRKGLQELACSIDPNGCWTDEAVYHHPLRRWAYRNLDAHLLHNRHPPLGITPSPTGDR